MPGEVIGLVAVLLIFGMPVVGILTSHHRKVLEMKLRAGQTGSQPVLDEIRQLKNQMTELRDTTTKYDVSFDSALQRIESRVCNVEQRVTSLERESNDQIAVNR